MEEGKKFFLITIDDLRRDRTSLEMDRDTTPFLEEFADRNYYQNRHFSIAPASPGSFRNIFTSTYPKEYEDDGYLSEERPYLPAILSEEGVSTVGLTTNPYVSSSFGFQRGYARFEDTVVSEGEEGVLNEAKAFLKNLAKRLPLKQRLRALRDSLRGKSTPYMEADEVVEIAKKLIETEDDSEDSFFWFHFMDPHYPFIPPEETFGTWSGFDSKKDAWKMLEEGRSDEVLDLYDECVLFLDKNLEKLVRFIKSKCEEENYEILITSDHGELFLEDSVDTFGHPSILEDKLYEVPLFLTGETAVDTDFSTHNDIAPTVLRFFNLDVPGEMKGIDLFSGEKSHDFVQTHEFSREDLVEGTREPKVGKITEQGIVESTTLKNPDESKSSEIVDNAKRTYYFYDNKDSVKTSELSEEQQEKVKENLRQLGYDE